MKYSVENYRVEQKTDYEKLVMEVTTDGSIMPKEALKEAAKILIQHFMMFSDEKITLEAPQEDTPEEFDEEVLHMRQLLKSKLVDMDLSVRAPQLPEERGSGDTRRTCGFQQERSAQVPQLRKEIAQRTRRAS